MKEIQLTQGKAALVDDEDYEWLNQWKWCACLHRNTWYAERKVEKNYKQTKIYMHRLIVNPPKHMKTDHKNGDGLDNQRRNLRMCTNSQNLKNSGISRSNSTGYKGVYWNKQAKKYCAQLKSNGKHLHVGFFETPIEAAKAYDEAVKKHYGEFARLNFPAY